MNREPVAFLASSPRIGPKDAHTGPRARSRRVAARPSSGGYCGGHLGRGRHGSGELRLRRDVCSLPRHLARHFPLQSHRRPVVIESQRGETCGCCNRNVIRASIAGQGASGRDWERAWCAPSPEANHRPKTVLVGPRANRGNPPTYPVSGSLGQAQLQLGSLRLDKPDNPPAPRSRR